MAEFKQFRERETLSGTPRVAFATPAKTVATDPVNMAAIMATATYLFATGWTDYGTTNGGVTLTKSVASQAYSVDLSDGEFAEEITGHSMTVDLTFSQVGNLELFKLAWMADPTTSVVVATSERILGLAAARVFITRSLVTTLLDRSNFMRAFYLRSVTNTAGDTAHALAPGALSELPVKLRAFKDSTATSGRAFGFIMEENNFGGVANSP